MELAIKGHPTRGAEVIEILEMLGGINVDNLYGDDTYYYYYITDDEEIDAVVFKYSDDEACIFSLEEFEEMYPYKVGDKVSSKYLKNYEVSKMEWESTNNRVIYKLQGMGWYNADELQPYKEETMEEQKQIPPYMDYDIRTEENMEEKLMPRIDFAGYCKDKYIIDLGDYEIKEENGKTYAVRKQPQYPKTYKECCKVLMGKTDFQDFELVLTKLSTTLYEEDSISPEPPHITLINNFYKLLICRDAHWRMTGEQMGLGKPWKPDWLNTEQDKFVIYTHNNVICLNRFVLGHNVLAFPTAEMRDAFLENFKELIEICKELL